MRNKRARRRFAGWRRGLSAVRPATTLVRIRSAGCSPTTLKAALLETVPPLIGRLEDDAFCLDPRTLDVREYPDVLRVLREALHAASRQTI